MIDTKGLPTPCYVIDEAALVHNLEILKGVQERTGAKILLAQNIAPERMTGPFAPCCHVGLTPSIQPYYTVARSG